MNVAGRARAVTPRSLHLHAKKIVESFSELASGGGCRNLQQIYGR
jgi:hypothetical protein